MSRKTVLLVCRDRAEYVAAIVERHDLLARLGRPFVPVIGPDPLVESEALIPYEPSSAAMTSLAGLSSSELFDRCAEKERTDPTADRAVSVHFTDDDASR